MWRDTSTGSGAGPSQADAHLSSNRVSAAATPAQPISGCMSRVSSAALQLRVLRPDVPSVRICHFSGTLRVGAGQWRVFTVPASQVQSATISTALRSVNQVNDRDAGHGAPVHSLSVQLVLVLVLCTAKGNVQHAASLCTCPGGSRRCLLCITVHKLTGSSNTPRNKSDGESHGCRNQVLKSLAAIALRCCCCHCPAQRLLHHCSTDDCFTGCTGISKHAAGWSPCRDSHSPQPAARALLCIAKLQRAAPT
jgi:hypothetical protein